jgi:hypothetical protein
MALNPYLSVTSAAINGVTGPNVVLTGCNLQLKSPTAETDASGLGNLIVGWNDPPPGTLPSPFRSGSNNLIVGTYNNFTSYGGFVAGFLNTVSGAYASISGGGYDTASAAYASISGGARNTASGIYGSVSGGARNTASAADASVSGGYSNTAGGGYASVSGGYSNTAGGGYASVSGGSSLTQGNSDGWSAGSYHTP